MGVAGGVKSKLAKVLKDARKSAKVKTLRILAIYGASFSIFFYISLSFIAGKV